MGSCLQGPADVDTCPGEVGRWEVREGDSEEASRDSTVYLPSLEAASRNDSFIFPTAVRGMPTLTSTRGQNAPFRRGLSSEANLSPRLRAFFGAFFSAR